MSDKRRHELVELSVDSRLPIIEDGAYRDCISRMMPRCRR